MHQGEDPETALRREVREETAIEKLEVVGLYEHGTPTGATRPRTELVGIAHWCRTIVREARVVSHEHMEPRWVRAEEATTLAGTDVVRAILETYMRSRAEGPRQLGGAAD